MQILYFMTQLIWLHTSSYQSKQTKACIYEKHLTSAACFVKAIE